MIVIDELRKVEAAIDEVSRVGLLVGNRFTDVGQTEPIPTDKIDVFVCFGDKQQTFYVEDHEWAQGTLADEIIVHMRRILQQEGNRAD